MNAFSGFLPFSPVHSDGCISKENHGNRAAISSSLIVVPALHSPTEETSGLCSDVSGKHDIAFMTPIREGFSALALTCVLSLCFPDPSLPWLLNRQLVLFALALDFQC